MKRIHNHLSHLSFTNVFPLTARDCEGFHMDVNFSRVALEMA